jgi:hypothetical protein
VEGVSTLNVTVDPDIAAPVRQLAQSFNATKPVARDHCAKVIVTVQPSDAVATGLTSPNWNEATLGPRPAVWIPESSRSVRRILVPGLVQGDPTSLATSPIVLAVAPALQSALVGAKVGWADLPRLQQGSLDTIGLSGWGGLGLALPSGDATVAVAEAVAEGVAGAVPLPEASLRSGAVPAALNALVGAAPAAAAPLTALAAQPGPGGTGLHAVATTARQVAATGGTLVGFQPAGPARLANYPATQLQGSWVDETQNQIAGRFIQYLTADAQQRTFAHAGFGPPAHLAEMPSKAAFDQLTQLLAHPILGVFTTVLLDTAGMGVADGADTRLNNVATALRSQLDTMPATSGLGLELVTKDEASPAKVVAGTSVLSDAQRTKLATALRTVRVVAAKSDAAYPALVTAYQSALNGYTAKLVNTVLLITAGPSDNSTMSADQLLTHVAAVADKSRPVRLDVLVISDTDDATMAGLAKTTGGTYTRVGNADTADLGATLGGMLAP